MSPLVNHLRTRLACLAAVCAIPVAAVTLAPAAHASSDPLTVSIAGPSASRQLQLHALPGDEVTSQVTITNSGPTPVTLPIYAVDATTDPSGNIVLAGAGAPRATVGSWLSLGAAATIDVPARGTIDVPVTVSVPSDAAVGDYLGGIVVESAPAAQTLDASSDAISVTARVVTRLGLRVYLTVDGQRKPGLAVSDMTVRDSAGVKVFEATLSNTGNQSLTVTSEVRLDLVGSPSRILDAGTSPTLLPPGARVVVQVPWSDAPAWMWGTATWSADSEAGRATAAVPLREAPLLPLIALVALLIAFLWGLVRFLRFMRRARAAMLELGRHEAIPEATDREPTSSTTG